MTIGSYEWKLKALTPIWTGDVDQKGGRLIPTGLMGSLRWWFEVLVRGLGGTACDPTSSVRCPDHQRKPTDPGHHCVVCELFGCTGWARKFRLVVMDEDGNVIQNQIEAGESFVLRFIPLRPIREEEWCLLDCTLRLIAEYGAIGGKTVLKPSDEPNRQSAPHHQDYGLIQYLSGPEDWGCWKSRKDLEGYVKSSQWRKAPHNKEEKNRVHDFSWASLGNFWCVKDRYLARQQFNQVIDQNRWLAGCRQESKKVFSFNHPEEKGRTFGFVKPGTVDFEEMKKRLKQVWQNRNFRDEEFLTGDKILESLCKGEDP